MPDSGHDATSRRFTAIPGSGRSESETLEHWRRRAIHAEGLLADLFASRGGAEEDMPGQWAVALASAQDDDHQAVMVSSDVVVILGRDRPTDTDPHRAWRMVTSVLSGGGRHEAS